MSFALNEIQQLIQQNTREFALKYIEPEAAQIDKDGDFPTIIFKNMAENDLLGVYLPEEYGGAQTDYLSYVLTVEEIAKASGGVAAILVNQASLVSYTLNTWGTVEQKSNFLTALCKGEKIGAFALTEAGGAPGVGPNRVVAVKDGDNYVLNGRKAYIANGGAAEIYIVFAVDVELGPKGMSAFVVEASNPGLTIVRNIGKMGLRGCPSAELEFKDVKIPVSNLLGAEGNGLKIIQETKSIAAVAEGALVIGIAHAAMESAAQYAKQRVQFGKTIASFPAIQNMLAEMATNIKLARLAIYDAANMIGEGEKVITEAAMIKMFVNRFAQSALADAIQIHGGYGYSSDMAVSRFYRDIKGVLRSDSSADFPEQIIAADLLD